MKVSMDDVVLTPQGARAWADAVQQLQYEGVTDCTPRGVEIHSDQLWIEIPLPGAGQGNFGRIKLPHGYWTLKDTTVN